MKGNGLCCIIQTCSSLNVIIRSNHNLCWLATELDRTRIVQSAPVRRLQQKPGFPLDVKASVRSRLTHSLEVQQAGRQIIFAIRQMRRTDWAEQAVTNLIEMSCFIARCRQSAVWAFW